MGGRAGEKRVYVELQRPIGVDADGYVTVDRVWAEKQESGGGESQQAGSPSAVGSSVFVIWWRRDIRGDWRVREIESGQSHQIVSYRDRDGRRDETEIFCVEQQ